MRDKYEATDSQTLLIRHLFVLEEDRMVATFSMDKNMWKERQKGWKNTQLTSRS